MYFAFADNKREITTDDIMKAIENTKPLARLDIMKEVIDQLREESDGRMRKVSETLYTDLSTDEEDSSRFEAIDHI